MRSQFFLIFTVLFLSISAQAQVLINEVCPRNTSSFLDEDDDNPDWIELYNSGNESVNLKGYAIADGKDEEDKWFFGDVVIPAKSHFLVFASGKDQNTTPEYHSHTSFKLSIKGEKVYLYDASASLIDQIEYPELLPGHSYGRQQGGLQGMHILTDVSPNTSNNSSDAYSGYSPQPTFSVQAGFYDNSQAIELHASEGEIRYTIDGSIPTDTSELYIQPIILDTTTVLCAAVFQNGYAPSEPIVNTYFIGEEHTLPVVSISTNPANLWDEETGIYVGRLWSGTNRNFLENWERLIHLEYFDNKKRVVNQNAGIKIHGGLSRADDNKSFRVLARSEYGQSKFKYKFFDHKGITEFKRLVLRNGGNSGNFINDALAHTVVQHKTHLDVQAFQPVVLYVNGYYWGFRNLREKVDKHYVEENHGCDSETIDMLSGTESSIIVKEGSYDNFNFLKAYIQQNDVKQQFVMDSISAMLDIKNFVDYFCAEIFFTNQDWPRQNIKYWRSREPGSKWRYVLIDVDQGLSRANTNSFKQFFNYSMLDKLSQNLDFEYYFTIRYADLLNTIFTSQNTLMVMQEIEDKLSGEMPRHLDRWAMYPPEVIQHNLNKTTTFLRDRTAYTRQHLKDRYALGSQLTISLQTEPMGESLINLNTITPETLPWSGIYFKDLPVSVSIPEDKANDFSHWKIRPIQAGVDTLAANIKFAPVGDVQLTACFGNTSALNTIENKAVLIYPNPAENQITINCPQFVEATIYSAIGTFMFTSNTSEIDLQNLEAGLYIVKVKTGSGCYATKFLKD